MFDYDSIMTFKLSIHLEARCKREVKYNFIVNFKVKYKLETNKQKSTQTILESEFLYCNVQKYREWHGKKASGYFG